MAVHNENGRLEAFCDGVFAIAITLLILEIKVPPIDSVHSISDLWKAILHLWPSFFAFGISFIIILIAWFNHHRIFKLLDKSSPAFIFANGFFLLTIVILPFPTALLGEYIRTDYIQPAVVLYCLAGLIHNLAWIILFATSLKPLQLNDKPEKILLLKKGVKDCITGFVFTAVNTLIAIWFPYIALIISTITWFVWIYVGLAYKEEGGEVSLG